MTSFTGNPLASDGVSIIPDIASHLSNVPATTPTLLTDKLDWPNEANAVPLDAIPGFTGLIVANGFLVPPKTVGAITLLATDASGSSVTGSYKVSTDKGNKFFDGWFYHIAHFVDMNGDGRKDIVTARATKPILGTQSGEFLWLEQPASDPLSGPWKEHVICSGKLSPDVFFQPYDIDGDGQDEFLFASFFTFGGFGVLSSSGSGAGRWDNSTGQVTTTIVDSGLPVLNGFAVEVVDLNGDGNMDVLYTNHVDNKTQSGAVSMVIGFEMPAKGQPFTNPANWVKHVLDQGYVVREGGPNQAAPGFAKAFFPSKAHPDHAKPSILVEGDGDQRFYELSPLSPDPSNWLYNRTLLYDCQGTVGQHAVGDVNGDGHAEGALFVFVVCAMCLCLRWMCDVIVFPFFPNNSLPPVLRQVVCCRHDVRQLNPPLPLPVKLKLKLKHKSQSVPRKV